MAFLPEHEKFEFTPHQLRHIFLKKVTDKHGVHFALPNQIRCEVNVSLADDSLSTLLKHLVKIC